MVLPAKELIIEMNTPHTFNLWKKWDGGNWSFSGTQK
jgi:hypothetical protein